MTTYRCEECGEMFDVNDLLECKSCDMSICPMCYDSHQCT